MFQVDKNVSLDAHSSIASQSSPLKPPSQVSSSPNKSTSEYHPGTDEDVSSESLEDETKTNRRKYIEPEDIFQDSLLFCMLSNLMELFEICHHKKCYQPLIEPPEFFTTGFMITIETRCVNGHLYTWKSCATKNRLSLLNLLIPAVLMIGGGNRIDLESLSRLLNLPLPSAKTFNRMYKQFLFPTVNKVYEAHENEIREELKDVDNMIFATDGAIDNPGRGSGTICHTAAMDVGRVTYDDDGNPIGSEGGSNLIFAFHITHISETSKVAAQQMEAIGVSNLLSQKINHDDRINNYKGVVTDAHKQMPGIIAKNQPFNPIPIPNPVDAQDEKTERITVKALKEELRKLNLSRTGNKNTLMKRLEDAKSNIGEGSSLNEVVSSGLNVRELKEELRRRGLSTKGNKSQLIKRFNQSKSSFDAEESSDGDDPNDEIELSQQEQGRKRFYPKFFETNDSSSGDDMPQIDGMDKSPPSKRRKIGHRSVKPLSEIIDSQVKLLPNKSSNEVMHMEEPWHNSRLLGKHLNKVGQAKENNLILKWIKPLKCHFFYSLKNCRGNPAIAREIWVSSLHHISNVHNWEGFHYIHECSHGLLSDDEENDIMFFDPNGEDFKALKSVVLKESVLERLKKCVLFVHTTLLEIYHSKLRKWLTKRKKTQRPHTIAKTKISIMNWNNRNARKKLKLVKKKFKGRQSVGSQQMKIQHSKVGGNFVLKNVYEYPEDLSQKEIIAELYSVFVQGNEEILKPYIDNTLWPSRREFQPNLWPGKEAIIQAHKSRFQ